MPRTSFFLLLTALILPAAQRPNILWLTSEDNDKQWLGCYGNPQAHTPHLDALAKRSVQFENFFSNAPVCAVARSTILTGVYAPSQGSQHMRSRHPIPAANQPYLNYLRAAGYYCTNATKTDFNFETNDKALWDDCGPKAHYQTRQPDQPFFAIFNFTESHESSLFQEKIQKQRNKGAIPQEPRIAPSEVIVPEYLPDLPEIRHDIATYHDMITLMDQQVGKALADLEKAGLAEDTIVFYYADHGGATPRGKRYLKDTGVNIPLLIHVPEKWQTLAPFANGSITTENAAFIDLAPTLLSLIETPKPDQMQGRAFLGKQRTEPAKDDYIFLYADRFDEIYGLRRGLTDGRWKYIRRFTPNNPAAPYSYYHFGQQSWVAWQKAWQDGKLEPRHSQIWQKNQAIEELFDTQSDRWEVTNLATDPAHSAQLSKMRQALKAQMSKITDTGIIPEPMFADLAPNKPIATYAASRKNDWAKLIDLAFAATARKSEHLPLLREKLTAEDPIERYWAAQGCLILGKQSHPAENDLRKLLADPHSAIRATAAQTLIALGKPEGAYEQLLSELSDSNSYIQQNTVNIFTQLDALDQIPDDWLKEILRKRRNNKKDYIRRFADKIARDRGLK